MNPVLAAAISAFLRHGLTYGAGFVVAWGIWTNEEALAYVGSFTTFLLTYGWSLYDKHIAKLKVETALEMPQGSSMKALDVAVANK